MIAKDDIWGNRKIIERIRAGYVFGEAYASKGDEPLKIHVEATEETEVLFLDANKIIRTCSASCSFHTGLIHNMLSLVAGKNLHMMQKMDCLTERTIRNRLLSYLSIQVIEKQSNKFTIPFNRQELADFLSVDRSALSAELSKMQKEGIIEYSKNHFVINDVTETF